MMPNDVHTPVTVLELENLPDGRQRLAVGVPKANGVTFVLHVFGHLELDDVETDPLLPLSYRLVMHSTQGVPLMELRIQTDDEPEELACRD